MQTLWGSSHAAVRCISPQPSGEIELTARVGTNQRKVDGGVWLPFKDKHARVWKSSPALDLSVKFNQDNLFSDTGVT